MFGLGAWLTVFGGILGGGAFTWLPEITLDVTTDLAGISAGVGAKRVAGLAGGVATELVAVGVILLFIGGI